MPDNVIYAKLIPIYKKIRFSWFPVLLNIHSLSNCKDGLSRNDLKSSVATRKSTKWNPKGACAKRIAD